MIHNEYKVDNDFEKKYKFRIIEWEGFFMGYGTIVHSLIEYDGIMIKMKPTDAKEDGADILIYRGITPDTKNLVDLSKQFKTGQKVIFKIRLRAVGDEVVPHVAEVEEIRAAPGGVYMEEKDLAGIEKYVFKKKKNKMFGKKKN